MSVSVEREREEKNNDDGLIDDDENRIESAAATRAPLRSALLLPALPLLERRPATRRRPVLASMASVLRGGNTEREEQESFVFFSFFSKGREKKMMEIFDAPLDAHKKASRLEAVRGLVLFSLSALLCSFPSALSPRAHRKNINAATRSPPPRPPKKREKEKAKKNLSYFFDGRRLWPRPEEQAAQVRAACRPLGEGEARQEQRSVRGD